MTTREHNYHSIISKHANVCDETQHMIEAGLHALPPTAAWSLDGVETILGGVGVSHRHVWHGDG